MDTATDRMEARRAMLSKIIKQLRIHRGKRTAEVAAAMGMPKRSYEHFEACAGRINPERVHQFAHVVGADPYAIFAALDMGSPTFALRSADNKLMTILMKALTEFDERTHDNIASLDARTLIGVFQASFDELHGRARERGEYVARWLSEKPPGAPDHGD
jgi:transcriptional regulator with XRE-family HTH domain